MALDRDDPTADAGTRHQRRLAAEGRRKVQGAYYTPAAVVAEVLDLVLDPVLGRARGAGLDALLAVRVVDPACGSGNFLAEAARRVRGALVAAGMDAEAAGRHVAARSVLGVDLDPRAATLCRASIAAATGTSPRAVRGVAVADALLDERCLELGTFDVVVGNPPFLNQLGAGTARTAQASAAMRERFGPAVGPYTDPAAAFLLLALRLARPAGGRVAMVEPVSLLTARDAAGARAELLAAGALTDLWVLDHRPFDAAVEVCVPVVVRGRRGERTRLRRGARAEVAVEAATPSGASSWSSLLADLQGLPRSEVVADGVLGDVASATADFRDQYYGLAPHVVDVADGDEARFPRLVTAGAIDPGRLRWGECATRFNKASYLHPRVDRDALPDRLGAWASARLVPKVLLATQTRVPEAVADPSGSWLPSVPVVSVVPRATDALATWRVAAVLTCPAVAAVVARRHVGSGRGARTVRLRASEVGQLPLPADRASWERAAELLADGAPLAEVGLAMDRAYGVEDDDLAAWWLASLPRR